MFFCIINVNEKCLSGFSEFIMSPLEYTPKLHPRHPLEILITKPPNGVFHKHREHGGWGALQNLVVSVCLYVCVEGVWLESIHAGTIFLRRGKISSETDINGTLQYVDFFLGIISLKEVEGV